MWKKILKILGIFILGFIIGILINIPSCNKQTQIIKYVPVHDTIEIEKERIVEKTKIKYINRIDTFYVKESGDTVPVQDLPIEHKIYEDTIKTDSTSTEIQVNYHGFDAGIDNIQLKHNYFEKETIIVKEPKKVGLVWAVGPSLGYSVTINPANGQLNHGISGGVTIVLGIGGMIK